MKNAKPLGPIEHVIVLMFENRSFDNVLGGLYPPSPHFDGVPSGWSNPGPHGDVPAFQAPTGTAAQEMPFPDPNEDFKDMEEQISGGTMKGFVSNYEKAIRASGHPADVRNIMQYYKKGLSGNIPITSALAEAYAVSDRYFGSGPVQTWPNRLFAHCATPGSHESSGGHRLAYLDNIDYPNYHDHDPFDGQLDYKTIFQLLDRAHGSSSGKAWKVYYDGEAPISAFLKYVNDRWNHVAPGGNVTDFESPHWYYDDFFKDISNHTLPTYSFIEPRYQKYSASHIVVPPNSNHPGGSTVNEGLPPISIHHGEVMLRKIFTALVAQKTLFEKTLLVITYDEHGGLFDHVTPPKAVSPFASSVPITNFNYDRYGPRVPAIFINPYIKPKTVLRPTTGYFDHTSIISTLRAQFCPHEGPLTPRDEHAPTFAGLIDTSNPLNFGPHLPVLNDEIPEAYRNSEPEPATYTMPERPGTLMDAVYRSYRARNRGLSALVRRLLRRVLSFFYRLLLPRKRSG